MATAENAREGTALEGDNSLGCAVLAFHLTECMVLHITRGFTGVIVVVGGEGAKGRKHLAVSVNSLTAGAASYHSSHSYSKLDYLSCLACPSEYQLATASPIQLLASIWPFFSASF